MFDRFLMYWLLWLLFIVIFFFLEEGKKRTALTVWLLTIISFSSVYVDTGYIQVSVSMMVILFGAFIYIVERSLSFMQLLRAFMMMIAYCVLMIWQLIAPVWFFLPDYFMIPLLIVFVAIFLSQKIEDAYAYVLLGVSLGQLLFDLLLNVYQLHNKIGMTNYFIHLSLIILLLIMIRTCFVVWEHMYTFLVRKWT